MNFFDIASIKGSSVRFVMTDDGVTIFKRCGCSKDISYDTFYNFYNILSDHLEAVPKRDSIWYTYNFEDVTIRNALGEEKTISIDTFERIYQT